MEFYEKLQELRKEKGMTQEELAEKLYVSRAAISKWESGRGYPNIESLKEISRFFSVSIDALICPEEILIAAKEEKHDTLLRFSAFTCGFFDIMMGILLFVPIFGNGSGTVTTVSLFSMTAIQSWLQWLFTGLIALSVLNGLCSIIICNMDKPIWNVHRMVTGIGITAICCGVFILSRQPYAGIICFSVLIVKGILFWKTKNPVA